MANHSSILAWKIPRTVEPGGLQSRGSQSQTQLSTHIYTHTKCSPVKFCYCLAARSDQIRSVTQSCPTLCDPMNLSIPGLLVCHQLPEFTQTHVHCVGDAIQPSHPLSSPSPPAPNPSQHQSLFQ